jgi:hypothetical protein
MTIGVSVLLIAIGAILTFAVNTSVEGVDINVIGIILMGAGGLGLLITLLREAEWTDRARRREGLAEERALEDRAP